MTWSDAALAGAFVIGATAGVFATVRVFKYALEYLKGEQRDDPN